MQCTLANKQISNCYAILDTVSHCFNGLMPKTVGNDFIVINRILKTRNFDHKLYTSMKKRLINQEPKKKKKCIFLLTNYNYLYFNLYNNAYGHSAGTI